jgi:hypothetical protein
MMVIIKTIVRPEEHEEKGCIRSTIKDDFYPDLKIQAVTPRWYYKKMYHGRDEYSRKILQSKKGTDESEYFKSYVEKCIESFDGEMGFSSVDLVTLIPNSDGKYYKNIIEIVKFVSSKFNKTSSPVFNRQPGQRTGPRRENRYKDIHGKFKIIDQDQIKGKKILLIDDIRTSGISILECADILLKAGAKEIISLSLGTNTSNEPPKGRA